jgi:hypothetical protein
MDPVHPQLDVAVASCHNDFMSETVRLSDELILDARLAAESFHRSLAEQIEFWARLGRAIEPLLLGFQGGALKRAGAEQLLSECVSRVDSPAGRRRVADYLVNRPFPHYEPCPGLPGMLIRIEEDGTRTRGTFVNRQFRPHE